MITPITQGSSSEKLRLRSTKPKQAPVSLRDTGTESSVVLVAASRDAPRVTVAADGAHQTSAIDQELERARAMTQWPHNWDGAGALPVARAAVALALTLLQPCRKTPPPGRFRISPCPDGSLDLMWRGAGATLVINVPAPESGEPVSYFARSMRPGSDPRRDVLNGSDDVELLLKWLK